MPVYFYFLTVCDSPHLSHNLQVVSMVKHFVLRIGSTFRFIGAPKIVSILLFIDYTKYAIIDDLDILRITYPSSWSTERVL